MQQTQTRQLNRARRGFTLAEILVVISIIIVVLAISVPVFSYIFGSRSQSASENVVSAMLARARVEAINRGKYVGVFFYLDPATDRTVACLVAREVGTTEDPDPYDNYKAWTTGPDVVYHNSPYKDRVVFFSADADEQTDSKPRMLVKRYRCIQEHQSRDLSTSPPKNGPQPDGYFHNQWWDEVLDGDLDLLPDTDAQVLSPGIGLQLVNDPHGSNATDRYVRTGCILFDPQGRLDSVPYVVSPRSALGQQMRLQRYLQDRQRRPLFSQFGLVTYDLTVFRNQGFTDDDSNILGSNINYANEQGEEVWLDNNTTIQLVNRTTGTLMKGE
jgi:Tfp pilus assembly protein FimT